MYSHISLIHIKVSGIGLAGGCIVGIYNTINVSWIGLSGKCIICVYNVKLFLFRDSVF